MEERKNDDKDGDLDGVSSDANKKKLKASDVYSDDSGSDSDSGSDFSTEKHGTSGKSSFPSSSKRQQSSSSSSSSDSDVRQQYSLICYFRFIKLIIRRTKKVARQRSQCSWNPRSNWAVFVSLVTSLRNGSTRLSSSVPL